MSACVKVDLLHFFGAAFTKPNESPEIIKIPQYMDTCRLDSIGLLFSPGFAGLRNSLLQLLIKAHLRSYFLQVCYYTLSSIIVDNV